VALSGLWLVLALATGPLGDFPLNDDWVYAATVRTLIAEGRFSFSPYTEASYVAQVVWGSLFCVFTGWSYSALRVSSALLGLAGVLFTFALLREAGCDRRLAGIGAVTLAVNPLYLNLSLTFMTDVPFVAWCLGALLCLARSLRRNSVTDLALGTALSLAAVLTRQAGVVVPLAFLATVVATRGLSGRSVVRGLVPSVVTGLALAAWHLWARAGGLDWLSNDRVRELIASFSGGIVGAASALSWRAIVVIVYVGLFALPGLVVAAVGVFRADGPGRRGGQFALTTVGLVSVALAAAGKRMPLADNVLYDLGVGPPTLWDVYVEHLRNLPAAPSPFWLGTTALAVLGGGLLAGGLAAVRREVLRRNAALCLAAVSAALYAALMVAAGFFDRYLVLLVPLCLVLAPPRTEEGGSAQQGGRAPLVAGLTLATAFGLFSVAATHDYFAWNRARWAAIDEAIRVRGIAIGSLDGGYEWNGLNRYSPTKPWWWADREPWVIAFGPVPGYREIARYPYARLVPPRDASVLLLRRDPQ
jgi:4-amino-4-deoxy-L-arabinose transferase-like glycosyltransferase